MKFKFKADIEFDAEDMESAIEQLAGHFDKMLLVSFAVSTTDKQASHFVEPSGWYDGNMELSNDHGEAITCQMG